MPENEAQIDNLPFHEWVLATQEVPAPPAEEPKPAEEAPATEPPPAEEQQQSAAAEKPAPPAEETPQPPVTKEKKKLWTPEFEQQAAELLNKKYNHTKLNQEQKAMAFLKDQNPELDEDELSFLAATEYGIGAETPDDDDLTDDQRTALKKQSIDRKKLFSKADKFFEEQASTVELPEPEADADPEYEQWKKDRVMQAEQAKAQAQQLETVKNEITNTAKAITEIKDSVEIELDERKLPVELNFKLDEKKQQKLVQYAERYIPSQEEIQAYTDTQTGKFDYKGYLESLAPKAFFKEMLSSSIKQAIAKDRERFVETELKNSTLRNNDVSETVDRKLEVWEAWPFGK